MGNSQNRDADPKKDVEGDQQHSKAQDGEPQGRKKKIYPFFIYISISVFIIFLSLLILGVSVSATLSTKVYTSINSGRSVGLVILDITLAIAITVAIFSASALRRKHQRQLLICAIVFIVLVSAQIIIVGVSVQVTQADKGDFSKGLAESFQQAQEENLRAVRLWHFTQHEVSARRNALSCCGVISPDDYKDRKLPAYFPAEVPISCCPSYDPTRTTMMQERQREVCKLRKLYYKDGCRDKVLENLENTETSLTALVVILIFFELVEIIWNLVYLSKHKLQLADQENTENNDEKLSIHDIEHPPSKKHSSINLKAKA